MTTLLPTGARFDAMSDVCKADPVVRRRVVLVLVVGACVGALLIIAFERYRIPTSDWLLANAQTSAQRVTLAFLLLAALVVAPLFAFAAYVWSLGERVLRAREFPPPGLRVIRDITVITGEKAVSRGRLLKVLALSCGIASAVLGLLIWRLAAALS